MKTQTICGASIFFGLVFSSVALGNDHIIYTTAIKGGDLASQVGSEFAAFGNPAFNNNLLVVNALGTGPTSYTGIFVVDGNVPRPVIDNLTVLPNENSPVGFLWEFGVSAGTTCVNNSKYFLADRDGAIEVILRADDVQPISQCGVESISRGVVFNESFACIVRTWNCWSVVKVITPNGDYTIDETQIPGFHVGGMIGTFSEIALSEGKLAITGDFADSKACLWLRTSDGVVAPIVHGHLPNPAGHGPFDYIRSPMLDGDRVAFLADYDFQQPHTGLYRWDNGNIETLVDWNINVPGFSSTFYTIANPSAANGKIVFNGYDGVNSASHGVYLIDDEGIQVVIRSGFEIDGQPIVGATTGPNSFDGRRIAMRVFRTNQPDEVCLATLCPAPYMLGDVNGDDVVSIDDVPIFVSTLLNPVAAFADPVCAADMNLDGAVNGYDIAEFLSILLELP